MLIPNKFNGYSKDGRRTYNFGGGGDSGGGGGQQTQVSDLPEWAKPYAQQTLAKTQALTTDTPYQSYGQWAQQRGYDPTQVAGFTGLQQQAFQGAQSMQTSPELGAATGIAGAAAMRGLGMGYDPYAAQNQYQAIAGYQPSQFTNQFAAPGAYQAGQFGDTYTAPSAYQAADFQSRFTAPGAYQAGTFTSGYQAPAAYQAGQFANQFQGPGAYQTGQFTADQVAGPQLEQYQMGPAQRVRTQSWLSPGTASAYMSPYMQNVVDVQQQQAKRQADIAGQAQRAQAAQTGGLGGARDIIQRAQAGAELQRNLQNIQAQGLQQAYGAGQQQFNTQQQAALQAALANQQAGLTVGQQNLAARLGVQQLGAQTGLQAALANQQAQMQAQQLAEQSRQFGAGQGLSAAQLQAQYGLSAQQAEEASRQFAANQAAQTASQQAQYGLQAQQMAEASRQFGAGQGLTAAQLQAQYGLSADQAAEASRQFGASQAAQIAAQQAQAKQAAQQAYEQSRQFGAGQGLTAAQLQAQYGMSAQQAQEAAQQFGYGQLAQQAAQQAQYGQAAQQLAEQSRQYGAGLGLQGLQAALQGAGQLGQLGGQQFQQAMDINKLQQAYGTQQQQLNQAQIAALQQQYSAQQKYPYQQLEFMANILRGTPMGTVQSLYAAQPTALQSLGSLGLGAYGLNQLMRAEGGTVSSYADGGSVEDPQNIEDIVSKLSDAQLDQAAKAAQARGDVAQFQIIQQEQAMRASERGGIAGAFNQLPQGQQQKLMAGGGIVAFAEPTEENNYSLVSSEDDDRTPVGRGDPLIYGQAMRGLQDLYTKTAKDTGWTPLSEKEEEALYGRSVARGKEVYGDVLSKIKSSIEAERGTGEEGLRQQRGIAALVAAGALSEGRGLMQGIGRAGSAFGQMYGKALEADAAQKRALTNMELNLAKAEADQRMGLHEKAEAQVLKANANRKAAYDAGITKRKAEADMLYKTGRLALPPAPKTGAEKSSPDERIAAQYTAIASGKTPYMGQTGPEAAEAYISNIGKSAAARTGARYTGPDKTFDRQVKLQQLYSNDPQLRELAAGLALAHTSGNQKRIDTLQTAITNREAALAKKLPELPAPTGKPGSAAGTTPPAGGKVVTMADVQATAAANNKTVAEVLAAAKAKGYSIQE